MNKSESTKSIFSLIINIFIFIAMVVSMLLYIIPGKYYLGINSIKYYTNLSNIFLGIASGIYIYINISTIKNKKLETNKIITLLKFYAVITTTITFVVVMVFLGPMFGFNLMFGNPQNILFHAVSPISGIVSFLFLDPKAKIEFKHTLYAFTFTVIYAIFYVIYVPITGDDFYGFNKNGVGILILIGVLILAANFGLASFYRFIGNKQIKVQLVDKKQ